MKASCVVRKPRVLLVAMGSQIRLRTKSRITTLVDRVKIHLKYRAVDVDIRKVVYSRCGEAYEEANSRCRPRQA